MEEYPYIIWVMVTNVHRGVRPNLKKILRAKDWIFGSCSVAQEKCGMRLQKFAWAQKETCISSPSAFPCDVSVVELFVTRSLLFQGLPLHTAMACKVYVPFGIEGPRGTLMVNLINRQELPEVKVQE
ncbi:hypothetical protein RJ641_033834 [Dillenia turbinata]|uniref:Uncharacterized protein n=1 Tax=Dillenia turbinata TaxID=194707 RepID=A0AAN8VN24_9MAGN